MNQGIHAGRANAGPGMMRITGTGHAGLRIDAGGTSILCDPWVNPAYFASWFPFPDNSHLDWDALGRTDYLYISHLHRDHFDPEHLRRYVSKKATVLLPEFPTDELRDALRSVGFKSFQPMPSGQVVDLAGGVKAMIQALTSPTDGPIGDSALWVEHDGVRLLNQNDARPVDLTPFTDLGHVHAHLLQFSGAIWYPMTYDLPAAAKQAFARAKRERQFDRTWRYIDQLGADRVFPIAGPPCFLDDDLWHLNDLIGADDNIFPDQSVFLREYAQRGGKSAVVLLPGSVADVGADSACSVEHPTDVDAYFADKAAHLDIYRARQQAVIVAEKATWSHPEIDVLAGLRDRIEPLLEASTVIAEGIGGPVRLELDDADGEPAEAVLIDFAERRVVPDDGRKVRYRFRTRRALVEHLLYTGEVDWANSLFLSCRFSASRVGPYNEYVYTFFKCLSAERLQYAEGWYAEQRPDAEDITVQGWTVQRRCPHLKADLARFGVIEDDVLTCQLHGWRYDLPSGRCLSSVGHGIRARRAESGLQAAEVAEVAEAVKAAETAAAVKAARLAADARAVGGRQA